MRISLPSRQPGDTVHNNARALQLAEKKLASLVENGLLLSLEKDREVLLKHILFGARDIAHCALATIFLKSKRDTLVFAIRTNQDALPVFEIPLYNPDGTPNDKFVVTHAALHNKTVLIDDVYQETRFDLSGTKQFSEESGFRTTSILAVPLSPRNGEVIGVLQLLNALDEDSGATIPFAPELLSYIGAMASQSALALDNLVLLETQQQLIENLKLSERILEDRVAARTAELEQAKLRLEDEKEVVESIVAKMHSAAPFDCSKVRWHLTSVDSTAGDVLLSAYRPDGGQHVMVGDFSGHGLPAAVAGPLACYIFYQMTGAGLGLEEILVEINNTLQRQLPVQIYMAACAVEIAPDRRLATFWNCGMPPALILQQESVRLRVISTELPLGILEQSHIAPTVAALALVESELIYIFSDGLIELPSLAWEEFGQTRLEKLLSEVSRTGVSLASVWQALVAHHGKDDFPDDATLIEISV